MIRTSNGNCCLQATNLPVKTCVIAPTPGLANTTMRDAACFRSHMERPDMKYSLILASLLAAAGLIACDRPTVVTNPPAVVNTPPTPKSDTVVVTPPASSTPSTSSTTTTTSSPSSSSSTTTSSPSASTTTTSPAPSDTTK